VVIRREAWPWALVFVGAVTLRLALYLAYRPDGVEPDGLGMALLFWKPELLQAALPDWWRELMSKVAGYWPPVYPYLCAAFGKLFDDPLAAGRVVSALASGALALAIAATVRFLTGDRTAGVFAAVCWAVAPLAVFWDTRVRPEAVFLLAYTAGLYFLLRHLGGGRRLRDLALATALAGFAATVKYEAVVLIPALAVFWVPALRRRPGAALWRLAAAAVPWALAAAWMLTHDLDRAGDYAGLFTAQMARQLPVWWGLSVAALPAVATWPVAALAVFGWVTTYRDKPTRPAAWLLLYVVAAHLATIAVGYNWIARYLLLVLPVVVLLAGVGWARLPDIAWLRWGAAGLSVVVGLFLSHQWVRGEADRWRETMAIGEAVARHVPVEARVWSDDPYLTPYYAGRDLQPLGDLTAVEAGDYVVLHDLYGALRHKRTVATSLVALAKNHEITVISDKESTFTPLAGDVIDPARLAAEADLRGLGPATFWERRFPITVRAALVLAH
jgi:Dolichyl-phosphate-mannose-protein mannosyltransferase